MTIDLGRPARGLAYIRHIVVEERYPGSPIYLTDKSRDEIIKQQFEVVRVGEREICEDEDCQRPHEDGEHVCELGEGDWVLVRNRAWMATPDPDVYVCRQDAILGKFVERRRHSIADLYEAAREVGDPEPACPKCGRVILCGGSDPRFHPCAIGKDTP